MGKITMITGAGGGLGTALASLLKERGDDLVLVGRHREKLPPLEPSLSVEVDVSTPEGAGRAVAECIAHFGRPPDYLAHCAGTVMIRPLHRTTAEQYRSCICANLDSAFYTLKAFVEARLEAGEGGAAVLVSSVAAKIGISNHEAIASAKAGVEGLVRAATASYAGRGIRVNGVAPALMRTGATEGFFTGSRAEEQIAAQYPLGRYGSPTDAASLIALLISEKASWISGQVVAVDGGLSAVRPLLKSH